MDAAFWHERWQKHEIGFHEGQVNRLLAAHFEACIGTGGRVFVPLCGKTRDVAWLLSKGCRVAGAELSETAIRELFAELDLEPEIAAAGTLTRFSANSIDIFVGDIFDLDTATLGAVDAVYDRAALVALPEVMRRRYAAHLAAITNTAPQLLVTFEYDQGCMEGPPFSIGADEVALCHGAGYAPMTIDSLDIPGGLKGRCAAVEAAWMLRPR